MPYVGFDQYVNFKTLYRPCARCCGGERQPVDTTDIEIMIFMYRLADAVTKHGVVPYGTDMLCAIYNFVV
jgi:hypothetical protein